MRRTALALALLIAPAAAQMVPMARQGLVPDLSPILEKICLPVAGGQPVAAGIAAAKSIGFQVTAEHGGLATLERPGQVLNLGPGNCLLTLAPASAAVFPHLDRELSGWLPKLGRYWVGEMEADAAGLRNDGA